MLHSDSDTGIPQPSSLLQETRAGAYGGRLKAGGEKGEVCVPGSLISNLNVPATQHNLHIRNSKVSQSRSASLIAPFWSSAASAVADFSYPSPAAVKPCH